MNITTSPEKMHKCARNACRKCHRCKTWTRRIYIVGTPKPAHNGVHMKRWLIIACWLLCFFFIFCALLCVLYICIYIFFFRIRLSMNLHSFKYMRSYKWEIFVIHAFSRIRKSTLQCACVRVTQRLLIIFSFHSKYILTTGHTEVVSVVKLRVLFIVKF